MRSPLRRGGIHWAPRSPHPCQQRSVFLYILHLSSTYPLVSSDFIMTSSVPNTTDPTAPLQTTWSVWTSKWKGKSRLTHIANFHTLPGFWDVFEDAPPSQLADKYYLHVFRQGISPMWEDPKNADGGHFKLTAQTKESSIPLWQTLTLAMIGEQPPLSQQVLLAAACSHSLVGKIPPKGPKKVCVPKISLKLPAPLNRFYFFRFIFFRRKVFLDQGGWSAGVVQGPKLTPRGQ